MDLALESVSGKDTKTAVWISNGHRVHDGEQAEHQNS